MLQRHTRGKGSTLHSCLITTYGEQESDIDKKPSIGLACATQTKRHLEELRCCQEYTSTAYTTSVARIGMNV